MKQIHINGTEIVPKFSETIITCWTGSGEKEVYISCPWCGEDIDGDDLEEIKSILLSADTNPNK